MALSEFTLRAEADERAAQEAATGHAGHQWRDIIRGLVFTTVVVAPRNGSSLTHNLQTELARPVAPGALALSQGHPRRAAGSGGSWDERGRDRPDPFRVGGRQTKAWQVIAAMSAKAPRRNQRSVTWLICPYRLSDAWRTVHCVVAQGGGVTRSTEGKYVRYRAPSLVSSRYPHTAA